MKIKKSCIICNKVFHIFPYNKNSKFCSHKCYADSMRGVTKIESRKRINKVCEVCNKTFEVRNCHSHVRTCSKECGGIIRRGKIKPWKKYPQKVCIGCKSTFIVKRPKSFCSKKCFLNFKTKNVKYPDNTRLQGSKWLKTRKLVIERDRVCRLCKKDAKIVHHKVPYSMTADDSLDNLILVCHSCHMELHNIIWFAEKKGYKVVYNYTNEDLFLLLEKV